MHTPCAKDIGFFRQSREITEIIFFAEVKASYRNPSNDLLSDADIDYKLTLGWERAAAVHKYAENMYWFHSRDEVTKEMMHHSHARDLRRAEEMQRCNDVGQALVKPQK